MIDLKAAGERLHAIAECAAQRVGLLRQPQTDFDLRRTAAGNQVPVTETASTSQARQVACRAAAGSALLLDERAHNAERIVQRAVSLVQHLMPCTRANERARIRSACTAAMSKRVDSPGGSSRARGSRPSCAGS